MNRVWRLDTERGSFAVKVLNQRFEDPIRRAEYRAGLDLERAMLGTGLRLPEPVEGQGGDWLMDLPCGTTRVHHWMEGRPVRDRQVDPRQAWQVGEVVAAAHAVGPPRQASPKEILRCWTPEHWEEPARILTELKPLPAMIEQVSEVVIGGRALIRAPVLCHCDVTSKNLVELPDGNVVLLDWDAAQPMEPGLELAAAAVNLAGYIRAQPRADVLRAFLAGYRMAGGRFTGGDHRVFAALLDGMLGWIWLNYRRAVAGRTSLERQDGRLACARAVDRMPHIVGSLPDWADELRR